MSIQREGILLTQAAGSEFSPQTESEHTNSEEIFDKMPQLEAVSGVNGYFSVRSPDAAPSALQVDSHPVATTS
eukprot:COSAG02_NODE_8_length_60691_cov_104.994752_42_plen_73_part_00